SLNFEVRLYEAQPSRFDLIYGAVPEGGSSATVGVQSDSGSQYTQFECLTNSLSSGLKIAFGLQDHPEYGITTATGATFIPGSTDIGNHCDDCTTNIALPFPFVLYEQNFISANVSSNGTLQFNSNNSTFTNS